MNKEERKLNIDEMDPMEVEENNELGLFGSTDVEEAAIKQELCNIMITMLDILTPEEREVVMRRCGFYNDECKIESRTAVSKAMGITVKKCYILEANAYRKLYKEARKKQLRDYIQ